MTLSMLEGPQIEPISVEEAKVYLKVDHDEENEVVAALITTARLNVERVTRRVLVRQNWRLYLDDLPKNRLIEIDVGSVREVLHVVCYQNDGTPKTMSPNDYVVDISSVPARIKFNANTPCDRLREINGYEIDFVAGYGPTTLDIPHDLRHAILMLVGFWYENRSAVISDLSGMTTPKGVNQLLQPFRVMSL